MAISLAIVVFVLTLLHGVDQSIVLAIVGAVAAIVAGVVDQREHRIPDLLTGPVAAGMIIFAVNMAVITRDPGPLIWAGICAAGAGVLFWAMARFGSMGWGDVKLAAVIGFALGANQQPTLVVAAFVIAMLAAGVVAMVLLISGRSGKSYLALGPYLALGTVVIACQIVAEQLLG